MKVVLVTGGAHRVGAAIVRAFASRGDAVAIHYGRSADAAEALATELYVAGGRVFTVQADLRDPEAPAALIAAVVEHFGQLDVLVNSASEMLVTSIEAITAAEIDATFALNVRAPFLLARAAAAAMPSGGVIVNLGDHLASEHDVRVAMHGASKAALTHLTGTLAVALAPRVRVNAVAPGLVLPPPDMSERALAEFVADVPLGHVGSPADVADAVVWLADAPYVTGAVIPVDGGRTLRR